MRRAATILATTAALTLAGCASGTASHPAVKHSTSPAAKGSATPTADAALEPVWRPKLDAASDGSVAACMSPSSDDCATAVGAIMRVVDGLDAAIGKAGRAKYPESLGEIKKMRAAQQAYEDNGCQGDPSADGDNSPCFKVMAVTVGASTLTFALLTDETRAGLH